MVALPEFLGPLAAGGSPPDGFDGGPTRRSLPGLAMTGQEETNWCWSAVTQAVLGFLRGAAPSQEAVASDHARHSGKLYTCAPPERKKTAGRACADVACQASCNDAHILRVVLNEQGCFDSVISANSPPTFQQIQTEIDAGRPVPCRIQWNVGGGHFIIVSGWTVGADGIERVHVLDPASNEGAKSIVEQVMPHISFATAYEQSGVTGTVNYSYRVR